MTSLRIAIADDELDMRDYLSRALPRLGHQVVGVAVNGRELVEMCERERPDLVLSDIRMPEMDGIDAAMQICRQHNTPVVLISAYHDEERIAATKNGYVLEYLVKPVKMNDLKTAIETAHDRFERKHGGEDASE